MSVHRSVTDELLSTDSHQNCSFSVNALSFDAISLDL